VAKPNEPKVRDLVPTGIVTEFGEAYENPDEKDQITGWDPTYVPGFSELRTQRDTELSEAAHGKRPPHRVSALPINLRWSRRTKVNGQPDETKVQKARLNGYEPVTKDDVGQPWFKSVPDGATILPDGTIAKGDTVLMKCAADRAARNAYRKQKLTMDRLGASIQKLQEQGMATDKTAGTEVQLGSQLKLPT